MSVENGKICCNCRRCIREWTEDFCHCKCEIDGRYLSYIEVMTGWCHHWTKDKEREALNECVQ